MGERQDVSRFIVLCFAVFAMSALLAFSSPAYALTISRAMCANSSWANSENELVLSAEVLDSATIVEDASVWVTDPEGKRFDLPYSPAFKSYLFTAVASVALGDYVFHAEKGGDTAPAVVKRLSSKKTLGVPGGLILTPAVPGAGKALTISWDKVKGAAGYFVLLVDHSQKAIWSSAADLWHPLKQKASALIPAKILASGEKYTLLILAMSNLKAEKTSTMSGLNIQFTPGRPFNMETSCVTTNSYPYGKFICLQVSLEDFFGKKLDKAVVRAKYPSGKMVTFVHNINGWYEPKSKDAPKPNDPGVFGTYTFYAQCNGKKQQTSRVLNNQFLPVPDSVSTDPDPLLRGEGFAVTWDPVPGATHYNIDVDDQATGKIIYQSATSSDPHQEVPPEIWNYLTSGSKYVILTQSRDAEDFSDASITSLYTFEFTAP